MAIDPTGLRSGPGAVRGGGAAQPATDRVLLDPRARVGALAAGQEVGARALADMAAGRHALLVEGRAVVVELPAAARAGEALRLTVLAREPTLLLVGTRDSSVRAPAGAPAALPTDASDEAEAGAAGSEVMLSPGARSLARLVAGLAAVATSPDAGASPARAGSARAGAGPEAAIAVLARTLVGVPQSGEPDALVAALSRSLAEALGGSGLFYESHQAQWVAGVRSLESLRAEPQGQRPPLAEPRSTTGSETRDARAAPAGGTVPPAAALEGRVDPTLAPMVQQQLGVLESRVLPWSGFAFPGVPLRIDLQEPEDEGGGGAGEGGAAREWATRLRVELPRLGAIEARLLVRGEQVVLSVLADSDGTGAELGAARGVLADRLSAAGLQVAGFEVQSR